MLRIGFALVIALMGFAAYSAYEVQRSLSEEALAIYRRHVEHDDALYRLRRTVWLGSTVAHDFLLDRSAGRSAAFVVRLEQLRTDSRELLESVAIREGGNNSLPELRTLVEEFWIAVAAVREFEERPGAPTAYGLIQEEIVPRREAVGEALREAMRKDQVLLERYAADLTSRHRTAAGRVLVTLALSLLVGLAVAVFSLAFSESQERQAARQHEEIAKARSDLQRLSVRLMEIQEQERARLSRELHDEIGQMLATLRLEAARAESAAARKAPQIQAQMAAVREMAERMIQIVRNIALLLRPSLLDDLGLGPALQWQAEDLTRRTGVPCEFMEEGLQDDLPEAVRTCVYRILQESLHNCEKYASASRVDISIQQSPGLLTMRVEDNGCGFELDSKESPRETVRFGILGMRERAAGLGGSVEVHTSPGRGTRVTLRLPLNRQRNPDGSGAAAQRRA